LISQVNEDIKPNLAKSKSEAADIYKNSQQPRGREQETRQRGQSKEQQRVARLVFKKRERSHDQDISSTGAVSVKGGIASQKKAD